MFCKCGKTISHEEAEKNKGLCDTCKQAKEDRIKIQHDLYTSFGGKGKRGFVQWLKKGRFLQGISEEADVIRHNDRIDVIEALIGGPDRLDRLLDELATIIVKMAKENADNN